MDDNGQGKGIFHGLKVLDCASFIAAPAAATVLSDFGADVIKIEPPGAGDPYRNLPNLPGYPRSEHNYAWHLEARNKRSIALDLAKPEAQAVLQRLVAEADVFIQNFAPGAAERLGFGAALRARYPRLIVCDLSGYGSSGPYRDKKAYDLLIQCETGVVSITGTPEEPSKAGIPVADIAGGMYAFSGILTALYQRERTGEGTALEVSLFDGLGEWMGFPAYYAGYGGTPPARTGASHPTVAPYGPFTTADEKRVFLSIQNDREWARFCADVLARPDAATDPRFATNVQRVAHREAMDAIIGEVFSGLTAEEAVHRLESAGIANARLNTVQEFLDHPQLAARDRWRSVDSPVGPLRALLPPVIMENVEPRMDPIPAIGAQTEAILREIGYDDAEIARLRAERTIGGLMRTED